MVNSTNKPAVVILISGRGSNMISIVEATEDKNLPITVAAVISNRPDAAGINYAKKRGIATAIIDHKEFTSRELFDQALALEIDKYAPELIVLAGFIINLMTFLILR